MGETAPRGGWCQAGQPVLCIDWTILHSSAKPPESLQLITTLYPIPGRPLATQRRPTMQPTPAHASTPTLNQTKRESESQKMDSNYSGLLAERSHAGTPELYSQGHDKRREKGGLGRGGHGRGAAHDRL